MLVADITTPAQFGHFFVRRPTYIHYIPLRVRVTIHGLQMPCGTLYRVAVLQTDVLENISPPSSGFLELIGFHSSVTVVITVESYHLKEP
jgi:hypothetical protein